MPSWDRKPPGFQPPAPHPTRPANPPMIFLIGPPVIRIRPKPPRINHLKISNRLKTHASLSSTSAPCVLATNHSPLTTRLLIATVAIRIRPKPPRINHLKISNRLKTHASLSSTSAPCVLATNHSPLTTRLLIAIPAIRISRNSHRINNIAFSNRHKTHPAALATQHSPLATELS